MTDPKEITNKTQSDAAGWIGAVLIAIKNKEFDSVKEQIEAIEKETKNDPNLLVAKALYLQATGQLSCAKETLLNQLNITPKQANARILLADLYYQNKEYEQAIYHYTEATKEKHRHAHPYFNCALAYCQLQNFDQANNELLKVINIDPNHVSALNQLGEISLTQKKYKQACDFFSRALLINNNLAETWHSLALSEFFLQQYQNAIDSFNQCLDIKPQHPTANQECANAYVKLNKFNDAIRHYYRQIEIKPCNDTFYNLAVCFMYQEKTNDAIEYFNKALKTAHNPTQSNLNLGSLYLKINNLKKAQLHYEAALSVDPENKEAQHILSAITQQNTANRAPSRYISSLFDQYANHYDQHLTQHLNYQTHQLIFDFFNAEEHDKKSLSILELGCGTGLCGELISPYANSLIGVDLSQRMLNIAAKKNIYNKLIKADIFDLSNLEDQFNWLIAADVFPYCGDLLPLLMSCKNKLTPSGSLLFSVESTHLKRDYYLQTSIRYAHSYQYLENTIKQSGFTSFSIHEVTLRHQYKKPVKGYIILAQI